MAAPYFSMMSGTFISMTVTVFSVIIGIAARPYIENIISGIVISFSKQLNTGDTVLIDNEYGTVEDITLSHTVIKIWDWRRYVVPNSIMLRKEFINYSRADRDKIWNSISFWLSHESDIEKARKIALEAVSENHLTDTTDPPRFWIMQMGKEGIECWIVAWSSFYDSWTMKSEVRTEIAIRFRKAGIKSHGYVLHTTDSCRDS